MTDNSRLFAELDRLAEAALGLDDAIGVTTVSAPGVPSTTRLAGLLEAAQSNAAVNQLPAGPTRGRLVKRAVIRLSRLFTTRQADYNTVIIKAVREAMGVMLTSLRALTQDLKTFGVSASFTQIASEELAAEVAQLRAEVLRLRAASIQPPVFPAGSGYGAQVSDEFYERFQDALRGSEEGIRVSQQHYIEDLETVRHLDGTVIDIGSGRGEFLRLVQARGFDVLGVDTNAFAVDHCFETGVQAIVDDGISYLENSPPERASAITCFHLVEHISPFAQLRLLAGALRALKPGGLLIMETPNPTNLIVGASTFYNDPTHIRPVTPHYLEFAARDAGFAEVELRYLHPAGTYAPDAFAEGSLDAEVAWALRGPQDYAIIARKVA
jgi:SAM-dependent methyltransferase